MLLGTICDIDQKLKCLQERGQMFEALECPVDADQPSFPFIIFNLDDQELLGFQHYKV